MRRVSLTALLLAIVAIGLVMPTAIGQSKEVRRVALPMAYDEWWAGRITGSAFLWGFGFTGDLVERTVIVANNLKPTNEIIDEYLLYIFRVNEWHPCYVWLTSMSPPPSGYFLVVTIGGDKIASWEEGLAYANATAQEIGARLGVEKFFLYESGLPNIGMLVWNMTYLGYKVETMVGYHYYFYAPFPGGFSAAFDDFYTKTIAKLQASTEVGGGLVTLVNPDTFRNAPLFYGGIYWRRKFSNYTLVTVTLAEPVPSPHIHYDATTDTFWFSAKEVLGAEDLSEIPQSPVATATILFIQVPGANITSIEGVERTPGTSEEIPILSVWYPEYTAIVAGWSIRPFPEQPATTRFTDFIVHWNYRFDLQLNVWKEVSTNVLYPGETLTVTVHVENNCSKPVIFKFDDTSTLDKEIFDLDTLNGDVSIDYTRIDPGEERTYTYSVNVSTGLSLEKPITVELPATIVHWKDSDEWEDVDKTTRMGAGTYQVNITNDGFMAGSNTFTICLVPPGTAKPTVPNLVVRVHHANTTYIPNKQLLLDVAVENQGAWSGSFRVLISDYYNEETGGIYGFWTEGSVDAEGKWSLSCYVARPCNDGSFMCETHFFFRPTARVYVNTTINGQRVELCFTSSWKDAHALYVDPREFMSNLYAPHRPFIERRVERFGIGGLNLSVTINLTNYGGKDAEFLVAETLPKGIQYVEGDFSSIPPNETDEGDEIRWARIVVPAGKSVTLQYNASGKPGTYVLEPTAAWDPVFNRTYYSTFFFLDLTSDVYAVKEVNMTAVMSGGFVEVTIRVWNFANEQRIVTITDSLPIDPATGTRVFDLYSGTQASQKTLDPQECSILHYVMRAKVGVIGVFPVPDAVVEWSGGTTTATAGGVEIAVISMPCIEQFVEGGLSATVQVNETLLVTIVVKNTLEQDLLDVSLETVTALNTSAFAIVEAGNFSVSGGKLQATIPHIPYGTQAALYYKLQALQNGTFTLPAVRMRFTYQGAEFVVESPRLAVTVTTTPLASGEEEETTTGPGATGAAGGQLSPLQGYVLIPSVIAAVAVASAAYLYWQRRRKWRRRRELAVEKASEES